MLIMCLSLISLMPRLTRQRLAVLGALERGAQVFPWILAALDIPLEHVRKDYARAHRVIMELVREGIVSHQKKQRHHASTFTLTPLGRERIAEHRRELEMRRQLLNESSIPAVTAPPIDPAITSVLAPTPVAPLGSQPDIDAEIKCPECGESVSLTRAKTLIDAGSKVTCRCTNDLTTLARNALSR